MQNYQVKKHDTLWKIAKRKGVTVEALARANKLKGKQIHFIREGQNLLIPDKDQEQPDTTISIRFRGLDHGTFTPLKVKLEHDNKVIERELDSSGTISLAIFDHTRGLKVWIEDMGKRFVQVLERPLIPIGEWKVAIESRQIALRGNLAPKRGPSSAPAPQVQAAVTHNAQVSNGSTARTQTRVDGGKPVHALASLYTAENLRLLPGNERYREHIVAAAKRHDLTPQSLAALIHAEAEKIDGGVWNEKSNIKDPHLAQGLGQFFEPAWMDVFNYKKSLIHIDGKQLNRTALLAKRHDAKFAIDGAAAYAVINLKNFARLAKVDTSLLLPEDKAKLAYLLHHDGVGGVLHLAGKKPPRDQREAYSLLNEQFGKRKKRTDEWVSRFRSDANAAYKAWIYSYTDSMINVNSFVVKDKEAFTKLPRDIAHIIEGLVNGPPVSKPAPRTLTPTPAPAPAHHDDKSPQAAEGNSWRDPLDVCTLRTAKLASVRSATFGMTRNGGKRPHQGIDLIAVPGTPVYAVANGTVYTHWETAAGKGYGHTLILEVSIDDLPEPQAALARKLNPGERTIGFFYAHLSEFCVKRGTVLCGTMIAKSGSTGNANNMTTIATGAHLHFEVRKDARGNSFRGLENRVDPLPFVKNCTNR